MVKQVGLTPLNPPQAQAVGGDTTTAAAGDLNSPDEQQADAKQAGNNLKATKADSFEGAARQAALASSAQLTNALTAGLAPSDLDPFLGTFAKDAIIGDILTQSLALNMPSNAAALHNLSVPELSHILQSLLGQMAQITGEMGLPLSADSITLLATLNGAPATLLDNQTDATTLWRGMALCNPPLGILALAATGRDIDPHTGLSPEHTYRILGTFIDEAHERMVRLAPGAKGSGLADEASLLAQIFTVPFTALQKAMLLALIGDPRIDMPYAQQLDETHGPSRAQCCMYAHDTGAASGPTGVSARPAHLSEPRCRSCAFARQLCLPDG